MLIQQYPYTLGEGRFTASGIIAGNFRERLAGLLSATDPITQDDLTDMSKEELGLVELYIKKYIELRPLAATILAFCDQLNSYSKDNLLTPKTGLLNNRSRQLIIDTLYYAAEDYYYGEMQLLTDHAFDNLIFYISTNRADFIKAGINKDIVNNITPSCGYTLTMPTTSFERDVYEIMEIIFRKRVALNKKMQQTTKASTNIITKRKIVKRKLGSSL